MFPEEDRTRDAVDSEPKHYQLSYSGPRFDFLTFFLRKFLPIRLSCCLCQWARVTFIDFILCLFVWSPKQNEGLAFNPFPARVYVVFCIPVCLDEF